MSTFYSKGNLAVRKVASTDKSDRVLNCVHFSGDGATVASNGTTLLAVGPVDAERINFPPVEGDAVPPASGVSMALDTIETAEKNLPRDKRVSLQHVKLTACSLERVELTVVSTRKEQRVASRPLVGRFPDWKGIVRKAKESAIEGRVCLRRKDLVTLLGAIDDAAGAGDEGATFFEFGGAEEPVVLRAVNRQTGQHVVGLITPLRTHGQWIHGDQWERGLFRVRVKTLKVEK